MSEIPAVHRHSAGRVVLLADVHLDATRPAMLGRFRGLCERAAGAGHPVYILGDLFEAWIGDDDDDALAEDVVAALAALTAGAPAWFMPGNRDFLVGERFLRRTGLGWLDDPALVELFGRRALLCHGDTLCTDDVAYQRFRAEARTAAWREAFLARPLAERRRLAAGLRDDSRDAMADKDAGAMDVNADAVADALRRHDAELLVHGHTHRPARHEHDVDGRRAERWVLADWYHDPAVLVADADGTRPVAPEDV
ncbi:MAG: UDP-2,3-diacylglucosamine diphosphatase [Halofilum sp. (in: g-proteobacteria)]|nr:UDP-2,3-diacylglucosamine diphosphatase [Halofilum sp. (in: g-proteobacteria)]